MSRDEATQRFVRTFEMNGENVLHVEVCQHASSTLSKSTIEETVNTELQLLEEIPLDVILYGKDFTNTVIKEHVESMIFSSDYVERGTFKIPGATIKYYVYRLTQEDAAIETMKCDSDELPVAAHWLLPAQEFHYMWENLYYDCDIKNNLILRREPFSYCCIFSSSPCSSVFGFSCFLLTKGLPVHSIRSVLCDSSFSGCFN